MQQEALGLVTEESVSLGHPDAMGSHGQRTYSLVGHLCLHLSPLHSEFCPQGCSLQILWRQGAGRYGWGDSPRMLKVGCPWSMRLLLWERRELGVELRGRFITWPHPALFLSGFVGLYPTPCPLGLSTVQGGPGTILKPHTPPPGPELLASASRSF